MSYKICKINILEAENESKVLNLLKEAYGQQELLPEGYLYKVLISKQSSKESFFLAAFEEGQLIGCCGFMATDFTFNNTVHCCYQGCWAATHPLHQGKKIFINIFKKAIELLENEKMGFIYEVAGDNTYPIFVKKLGFEEIPAVMVKIPNLRFVNKFWFNKNYNRQMDYYIQNYFLPVESQIIELKKNIDDKNVIVLQVNDSFIWGKVLEKKKFGIRLKYFYVGGVSINDISDYHPLIKKIFKDFSVHYIQLVSAKTNKFNELLKGWRPARINPFLIYNMSQLPSCNQNLMYGAIDVF